MAKKLTIKTASGTTTVIVPSKQDVSEQIKEAVIDAFIDVDYNPNTGVLTFEQQGGGSKSIDLPLELIVESGYYDSETQELVLVLANGQEIRIPIGDLLNDLDAHNIRFNGSGTNYLVSKTDVESAVKELDTQVKTNVDSLDDRIDTIIAGTVEGVSGAEIVDARKGKPLLGDKIEEIDEKFELQNWELQNKTRKTRPIVTFIDDDGRSEVWTRLKPIADLYNIPMCVAMVTNRIDDPDGLSVEQLKTLVDSGWEILSHTHTHQDLSTLTYEEQEYELKTSKEILTNLGFDVQTIAYPYGGRNDDTIEIARKYYRFGRATDDGRSMPNQSPLMSYDAVVTPLGSYFAFGNTPYPSDSLEYYKYMVDKTVETGGWLIFMTHIWNVSVHDETQQQHLKDVIEYIQSLEIPIMTVRDALNERANIVDIGRYWNQDLSKKHFVIGCDGKSSGDWLQSSYKVLPNNTFNTSNKPIDFPNGTTINVISTTSGNPESTTGILISTKNNLIDNYGYGFVRQEFKITSKNVTYERYSVDNDTWSDWQLLNTVIVYPNNSRDFNSPLIQFQNGGISYVRMTTNQPGGPLSFGGGLLITNRVARYEPLQYQEFVGENNPDRVFRRWWSGSSWSNWLRITPVALTTTQRNSVYFQKNIGDQVFDTTLGKPIWWNGTKWVLSDGSDA